ncbi:MAG: histidine kinase dimerization/phosphoacceptor domain -containing protein [Pseudomonadota bacterium]
MIWAQRWGGLRVRLILLTLLALLPLGLIALWQTFQSVDEARALNERVLINATEVEAVEQRARIKQSIGAGQALGAVARVADLDVCRRAMQRFLENDPSFVFAGFVPVDGRMECSSAGDQVVDLSAAPNLQDAIDRADVYVDVNSSGAVTGQYVLIVSVPVFGDGALLGFLSLSTPMQSMQTAAQSRDEITLIGISTSGNVFPITDLTNGIEKSLPSNVSIENLRSMVGQSFLGEDHYGEPRMFSVTQPVGDSFVVVGSWAQADLINTGTWRLALAPLFFAVLMWGASMAVSYLGLTRLVLKPLAELRSAMRRFALGERSEVALRLQNAPEEFKDSERAFNRMAVLITEAEARQLTDLHDKEVLLREVHHRVKNNLQMIASIMNLQARNARTDEAREVLDGLQRRVRGLAMLHRSLYTEPETSCVDARDLVAAVVSDTSAMLPGTGQAIETDLHSAALYPDQAVPLSMWVAEALTNAVKYAGADASGAVAIAVSLQVDDSQGAVSLRVENSVGPAHLVEDANPESTGLGTKLMTAFCRQLDGTDEVQRTETRYIQTLRFQIQDFQPEGDDGRHDDTAARQADPAAA